MTRWRQHWQLTLILVIAGLTINAVRPQLFAVHEAIKEKHDVYFLPPPEQVLVMSLGYKAAVVDILWAHVLVSQGLHTFERRRFENLSRLYDVINELDPTWRTPYLYVDTLNTFQTKKPPLAEVYKTREILERGAKNLPYDAEIWLNLGQFISFVAPAGHLDDKEVAERWRREGVPALIRAAELGADNSAISWQAMGVVNILREDNKNDALVRFLQRVLAVTDDEALKKSAEKKLRVLLSEQEYLEKRKRHREFWKVVRKNYPFVSLTAALAMGYPTDPAFCAGPGRSEQPSCALNWRLWWGRRTAGPASTKAH